jgi:hypothetical protein
VTSISDHGGMGHAGTSLQAEAWPARVRNSHPLPAASPPRRDVSAVQNVRRPLMSLSPTLCSVSMACPTSLSVAFRPLMDSVSCHPRLLKLPTLLSE